jgi:hypothetical protein
MGQKPQNMGQVVFSAFKAGFRVRFLIFFMNCQEKINLVALFWKKNKSLCFYYLCNSIGNIILFVFIINAIE